MAPLWTGNVMSIRMLGQTSSSGVSTDHMMDRFPALMRSSLSEFYPMADPLDPLDPSDLLDPPELVYRTTFYALI